MPGRKAEALELVVVADPVEHAGVLLAEALAAVPNARVAIPGGSAVGAYGAATKLAPGLSDVRLTWVDERCVPVDDADSNRGTAYRRGWVDPGAQTLALYEDGETPAQARDRVRASLATDFDGELDIVLLGMGADGHVASLFIGREIGDGPVAIVEDSPKPPSRRITLTREILSTARTTILVAMGEAKRDALSRLLSADDTLPAYGLPGLVVVTDQDLSEAKEERR